MRSMWKGLISFGLVNIPVALYSAVEDKQLHFNQLHKEDGGRIGYDKVCKECGKSLEAEEIVRGYEYEKGRYVTLSEEEMEKFDRVASRAIAMQQFVDASEIDAMHLDTAYYLGPDEVGKMPYALLLEALKRSKKVGVAKLVMRDKEYLALIRPVDQVLVLHTMHYPDEIRKPEGLGLPSAEVQLGKRELEMADLLVKSMSGEFHPAEFTDTHREEMLEMILGKAEGAEDQPIKAKLLPTNVTDLVARLKASIDQAEQQKKAKTAKG
ncbi:MAG: non-homologous end joining protein Ku [Trichloromonadaceae bacterium]